MKKTIALFIMCVNLMFTQTATVSINSTLANVDQLSINDFNILGQGAIRSIFTGNFVLNGFGPADRLQLQVNFTKDGKLLFSGTTNQVTNPANQTINFNSSNLGTPFSVNLGGQGGSTDFDFDINVESDADFKSDQSIPTILPNGRYVLTISTIVNDQPNSSDNIALTLNNQWQITLSSPYNWETVSTRPFFQWFSPSPFREYKYLCLGGYEPWSI